MKLYISQKTLGKRQKSTLPSIAAIATELDIATQISVQDLLIAVVTQQVITFNHHVYQQQHALQVSEFTHGKGSSQPQPAISSEAIENYLLTIGKVDFDALKNLKTIELNEAINITLSAFGDGLVVLFINEQEIQSLDEVVTLYDGCHLVFIRLTFLAGGWF